VVIGSDLLEREPRSAHLVTLGESSSAKGD
jgi:hypothetical protein